MQFGQAVKITTFAGYNNQPSFLPDGRSIFYTSIRDKQADIYRYDIRSGATSQITNTPESEYSPMLMPDGKNISVVRVEADGTQRLWKFPLNGGQPEATECHGGFANLAVARTRILQGSQYQVNGLSKGEHHFQCCIHPWMRVKVEVK